MVGLDSEHKAKRFNEWNKYPTELWTLLNLFFNAPAGKCLAV